MRLIANRFTRCNFTLDSTRRRLVLLMGRQLTLPPTLYTIYTSRLIELISMQIRNRGGGSLTNSRRFHPPPLLPRLTRPRVSR